MKVEKREISPNVILLGNDLSQYSVLRMILGEAYRQSFHEESKTVYVIYGDRFFVDTITHEGIVITHSPIIPKQSVILCVPSLELPKEYMIYCSVQYWIVEGETYDTESTRFALEHFHTNLGISLSSVGIILYCHKTRRASTDLKDTIDPAQSAKEKFSFKGIPTFIIQEQDDPRYALWNVLFGDEPWNNAFSRRIKQSLKNIEASISHFMEDYRSSLELELEMNEADGYLGIERFLNICSFSTLIKFKKSTMWGNYIEALKHLLFPENKCNGIRFAVDLYADILKDIPGWPLEKDIEKLEIALQGEFYSFMQNYRKDYLQKKGYQEKIGVPETKEVYDRELSMGKDTEINVEFQNAAREYLTTHIPQMILTRLNRRYDKLKKIYEEL